MKKRAALVAYKYELIQRSATVEAELLKQARSEETGLACSSADYVPPNVAAEHRKQVLFSVQLHTLHAYRCRGRRVGCHLGSDS